MIWKVKNKVVFPATEKNLISFLEDNNVIGVDNETTGLNVHTSNILSIQFGNQHIQFVVDCNQYDITKLKPYLEDPSKLQIYHNAKFDLKFLYKHNIYPVNIYDTFLAECILKTGYDRNESELSLKDLGYKYVQVELDKSVRGIIHREGLSERVIIYGASDVEYLELIMEAQLIEIKKYELERVLELENNVVKVIAKMEFTGICIDSKKWIDISTITETNVKQAENVLNDHILDLATQNPRLRKYVNTQQNLFDFEEKKTTINWASPDQKKKILSIILNKEVEDVSDKTLQKLKKETPLAKELINLSKNQKLSTSFGIEFLKCINPITGKIHPETWQILQTGRMSQENPNLLQIPSHGDLSEKIKACFVAREGYLMTDVDVSGFELRIMAEFSQDPLWLDVFNRGGDLHSELCAKTFNIPLDKVKEPFPHKPDFTYRFIAKTVNFMLSYGGGAYKLSDIIQISKEDAQRIINQFFAVVPTLKKFLETIANLGATRGFIRTNGLYKRRRWFPNLDQENFKSVNEVKRASMNSVPQGKLCALYKFRKFREGCDANPELCFIVI